MTAYPLVFRLTFPDIENKHRRQLLWAFRRMFITMIGISIISQLASGFTARPLAMSLDLRFHSVLVMQVFGMALCLLASFMCGVKHMRRKHLSAL
jgi:hypothetical protein